VDDPALSPELAPPPTASIFLLHGHDDNIIPPAESVLLANHLRLKGVRTRVLLSGLITHASVNEHATAMDALKLMNFWAAVIKQQFTLPGSHFSVRVHVRCCVRCSVF